MRHDRLNHTLLGVLTMVMVAACAEAADLPLYPDQQRALLRQTEDDVLQVQRQLFAARQRHDAAAAEELGKQFKSLQDKRRALITATKDQLPGD